MEGLKTYWDLSERERGALTREEVERWVDVELMTNGVAKIAQPVQVESPELPPRRVFYTRKLPGKYGHTRSDVVFTTPKGVDVFDGAFAIVDDYALGLLVAHPIRNDAELLTVECITADQAVEHRAVLEQIKSTREANDKAQAEYEKSVKAQRDALSNMWDDWHQQGARDRAYRKVVETFNAYVVTAGGDGAIAARFLTKLYSSSYIAEAAEWCGIEIPDVDRPFDVTPKNEKSAGTKDIAF